jgi:tetratricopeptide (TPR) repeat protein
VLLRSTLLLLSLACLESMAHDSGKSAMAHVSAQILQSPDRAEPYVRRAALYLESRDWAACLVDLEHAARLHETGLYQMQAEALLLGKHERHAIALLDAHAEDAGALWIRARAKAALGDMRAAAIDCQEALKKLPRAEPDLYLQCADFYCRDGQMEKALSVLDSGPKIPALVQRAIHLETQLGRTDQALRRLDALIASSSVPESLIAQRASLLAQAGQMQASLETWEKLHQRIAIMQPPVRGSQAMSQLFSQSNQAISALRSIVTTQQP